MDVDSSLLHTVVGTATNVNDLNVAGQLLHDQEDVAFGNADYKRVKKRVEAIGPEWHVAMWPGPRRKLNPFFPLDSLTEQVEQKKASLSAKV